MTFEEWMGDMTVSKSSRDAYAIVWNAAVKAERERCAKLCESTHSDSCASITRLLLSNPPQIPACDCGASKCAKAIREQE